MRITNQIMQNNSLLNINKNKVMQDTLYTQMSTEQKISRPSDDPVIAIRSLRLNTSLSELIQYNEKNAADAKSWMDVTDDAIESVATILEDIYKQCGVGASEAGMNAEARKNVLTKMSELSKSLYEAGNTDYIGRGLFTGFRTDSKLTFQSNTTQQYLINEKFDRKSISSKTYVETGDIMDVNNTNYNAITTKEQDISSSEVDRIRLSYDNLSDIQPTFVIKDGANTITKTVTKMHSTDKPSPYLEIAKNPDAVIFIPETGEMLLGANVSQQVQGLPASAEVNISYEKQEWKSGDLRPEHYFTCTADSNDPAKQIEYNKNGMNQEMNYDVGYNQSIRVNTLANELFDHGIGREVNELIEATQAVLDIEDVITRLESMKGNTTYNQTEVQNRLDAAKASRTRLLDKEKKLYGSGLTNVKGYQDKTSQASTNVGSRGERLKLIQTRLSSQQDNFEALEADNIGVDMTKVLIKLESAGLAYDAALMAIGKISQNSLMNYI